MNHKLIVFPLLILCFGLIDASVNSSPVQVIIMDERPIGSPALYIGYTIGNGDQAVFQNIGKIEVKSGKDPVSNKFMIPSNTQAIAFDTTQKNTGNFYISYTFGQGYKLTGVSSVTAVYNK